MGTKLENYMLKIVKSWEFVVLTFSNKCNLFYKNNYTRTVRHRMCFLEIWSTQILSIRIFLNKTKYSGLQSRTEVGCKFEKTRTFRGWSFLMGNTRPECFPQKSPELWDPLFFRSKFWDPLSLFSNLFQKKISDP